MVLHELATGRSISISENLGAGAISCRLSTPRLLEAAQLVEAQLADVDIVFLNKFGKAEAEGGGLRDLIARFGRFPHRNAALGRESTAEEARYLEDPSVGFGQ